jgi:hypothetical protein
MLKNNKLVALCQPDMDWGDMKNTNFFLEDFLHV